MSATRSSDGRRRLAHRGAPAAFAIALVGAALTAGCQSLPERVDRRAESHGMERRVVTGDGFRHVVYQRAGRTEAGQPLHVYLEGDGRPWIHGVLPAADPTPRTPYALDLMARDPQPGVYLGRPCYFGLHDEPGCEPPLWTDARYGPEIVASMAAALARLLEERDRPPVVLVGYSGGGALAVLLADRVPNVRAVVTVSANLDTGAWTAHHGYRPLAGSLDPMAAARLRDVDHVHLAGAEDDVVPADQIRGFAQRHGGRHQTIEGFGHRCCWRERWPALLRQALSSPTIRADTTRRGNTLGERADER